MWRSITPGKRFVSTDEGGTVNVWDAATLDLIVSFKAASIGIYRAKFTPDGTRIVTASGNWQGKSPSEIRVWDTKTGLEIDRFPDQAREVWDIAFLSGGKQMVTIHTLGTTDESHVKIWDFDKKQVVPSPFCRRDDQWWALPGGFAGRQAPRGRFQHRSSESVRDIDVAGSAEPPRTNQLHLPGGFHPRQ